MTTVDSARTRAEPAMVATATRWTDDRPVDRRTVPRRRQNGGFAGVSGLTAIQSAPSADCALALLVGLLGGAVAGLVVARLRSSDGRGLDRAPPTFQPPPVSSDRSEDGAFPEEPPIPGGTEPTDEEEVLRLLVSNGGRMKQSRIVESTGWSKAKVSRLLSSMEERGEITKLTHGRENLIFSGTVDEPHVSGDFYDR
ncbi:helix-turn-helix transcriptional regulator [Halalkalicoccus salilacus]|uniref:helix-turn-helix transcriptional regulator n=1 Tax=Halalkalicoccus TaxID=332246 RepID=UPI002F96526A